MYLVNVNRPQFRKTHINKLMNELAHDFFSEIRPTSVNPQYNVLEGKNSFSLVIALPGISKKDIDINLEKNILNIKVNSEAENQNNYLRKEFGYLSFNKDFRIPKSVDGSKISAKMEKGILSVSLPKREEAKEKPARNITIK